MRDEISKMQLYFEAANYITVAQLYLEDNFLLKRPLISTDFKQELVGHWGTAPAFNFIYTHINGFINRHRIKIKLIVGTGHAAAPMIANLFLERALPISEYEESDLFAFEHVAKCFGKENGFQTEVTPYLPGVMYMGGELGHSLSVAYGMAFDNPEAFIVCIVGDGELETGPALAGLNGNKFVEPIGAGVVLPIINLNGYKMTSPSLYSLMTDDELKSFFDGLGYVAYIVNGIHEDMIFALDNAYEIIQKNKEIALKHKFYKYKWPIIILRTVKGWTGIKKYENAIIEDSALAHKIPVSDFTKVEAIRVVDEWMKSYVPEKIFDERGMLSREILDCIPEEDLRIGNISLNIKNEIRLEDINKYSCQNTSECIISPMRAISKYFCDIYENNRKNFKIFSPDEIESNQLQLYVSKTKRQLVWPARQHDLNLALEGGVVEILSEHVCHGWLQGYILTGKHGFFITYEAFASVASSMIIQYIKFLKQHICNGRIIPSMNYLLTSLCWRNCYSHQNPDVISTFLNSGVDFINIYFPIDANSLLVSAHYSLISNNQINVIVSSKNEYPIYFSTQYYKTVYGKGYIIWPAYSEESPDIVICSIGDYNTKECFEAICMFGQICPKVKVRFITILKLTALINKSEIELQEIFSYNAHIILSYIGYISTIKSAFFNLPHRSIDIYGYKEYEKIELSRNIGNICNTSRIALAKKMLIWAVNNNYLSEVEYQQAIEKINIE